MEAFIAFIPTLLLCHVPHYSMHTCSDRKYSTLNLWRKKNDGFGFYRTLRLIIYSRARIASFHATYQMKWLLNAVSHYHGIQ